MPAISLINIANTVVYSVDAVIKYSFAKGHLGRKDMQAVATQISVIIHSTTLNFHTTCDAKLDVVPCDLHKLV